MSNRLASAQSAYLRQHADNPVDWWPWSAEAFAEAQRRDVPVFISIGYAACHWCHVMARESFEDDAAAELLNARFVAIKVDREERPDVDDTYMAAVQAMTGMGGWPMSVFATPQGRVFHAGTYFPPQRRGQVPSFSEVCDAVHEAWTQRRDQVESQAEDIAEALAGQRRQQSQMATAVQTDREGSSLSMSGEVYADLRARTLDVLAEQEDDGHGGFGAAPKFPPSPLLGWLLEDSAWNPEHPQGSWRCGRWPPWDAPPCSTTSRAGSRAMPQTARGPCRTSRRCSTTMLSCWATMPGSRVTRLLTRAPGQTLSASRG
ncbi:thioredoxin domain-containing protein [Nesterenkonia pannonica]|uniref:thioredoxin domain-containing protein n=1 Tax=Nesterenkonia pannonica TaxID=1548602 RepID=UPI002164CFDE|nr:thioredoxin domain-containing protein [Nesterenkonia pannonica]